ncbi:MAG: alpha/beta hydrolase [Parvularculaceae bacterium]|nr:alpha/beta hydrolase [Parvularculaceae bacterium]
MNSSIDIDAPDRIFIALRDGEIAIRRYGRRGAPRFLFAHANGFCASAYRQVFAAMGDRFDIYAVDLRGHGRSRLPADPLTHRSMAAYGKDVAQLLDALGDDGEGAWTLAGHSLGAVSVTLAAVGRGDVAALRLIEPVATPRWYSALARTPLWRFIAPNTPLVKGARGRRGHFADRAAVKARYSTKSLFAGWADGVLDDYLTDGLYETQGGVALSCAPAWEAATFAGQAQDIWSAVKKAPAPIRVLAVRHPTTTVRPFAIRRFRKSGARVEIAEGLTHLAPFENAALAARFLLGE